MPARLTFDLGGMRSRTARRRDAGSPLRILVLGDFGGTRNATSADFATRPVPSVDIDTLDAVLERLAPSLQFESTDGAAAQTIVFKTLDDFHPDALFRRLPLFQRLRDWRARLRDARQFDAAAAELRAEGLAQPAVASAPTAAPPESDSGTLERLLGRAAAQKAPAPAGDTIDALVRQIVAPHIAADRTPFQAQYLAALDAVAATQMRRLLRDPAFRALEMAWRGLHWLTTQLELGAELQLHLLDATRAELGADFAAAQGEATQSALLHRLRQTGTDAPDGAPWSLVVGLMEFGAGADDLALLADLGTVCAATGASFVGAAAASFFGCPEPAALPDPARWSLPAESARGVAALRREAVAASIGLAAPRLLLRLPYGAATDPIESFVFEEVDAGTPVHDALAWANGALAVALRVGQTFGEGGWDALAGAAGDVAELPAYVYSHDGEKHLQPCAEAFVGERGGEVLRALGLIPLLSHRQRAAVRVLALQSLAEPAQLLDIGAG